MKWAVDIALEVKFSYPMQERNHGDFETITNVGLAADTKSLSQAQSFTVKPHSVGKCFCNSKKHPPCGSCYLQPKDLCLGVRHRANLIACSVN